MNLEHENTARRLRDEPVFALRQWRCRLGIHTWYPWSQPNKQGVHSFVEQYRTCGFCGKAERRKVDFVNERKK